MALITLDEQCMSQLKSKICEAFEITDNGPILWMLSIEVWLQPRSLALSQLAYIWSIHACYGLSDAQPLTIPANLHVTLTITTSDKLCTAMAQHPYCQKLGALMYTAIATCLDIAYAINTLVCYQDNPSPVHQMALNQIYTYLGSTEDLWLTYTSLEQHWPLAGYVDTDGHMHKGRHTISGYVFTIDGSAISWSSKWQELVTLSTTKAKYVAQTHAAKEVLWLSMLCTKIFDLPATPLTINADNMGAITLAHNDCFHACTKHINIRYHFIHKMIEHGKLILSYIPSANNIADIFTKALPSPQFKLLVSKLGLHRA
jgi:hypothetical protein